MRRFDLFSWTSTGQSRTNWPTTHKTLAVEASPTWFHLVLILRRTIRIFRPEIQPAIARFFLPVDQNNQKNVSFGTFCNRQTALNTHTHTKQNKTKFRPPLKSHMCLKQESIKIVDPVAGPPRWALILFPLLAGLLHVHVVYNAVTRYVLPTIMSDEPLTSQEFMERCYMFERAAVLAYTFDLFCCYIKILPFSRCNKAKDIVGHHAPILLLVLPLSIPIWADLRHYDPNTFRMLDLDESNPFRQRLLGGYLLANGLGFISSFNEVLMCFQRVEMNIEGVSNFKQIPRMKNRIFSSRVFIGVELYYKFLFFTCISVWAIKNCAGCLKAYLDFVVATSTPSQTHWEWTKTMMTSPLVIRGLLFKIFCSMMYPSMGLRTFKKIRQFHREGRFGQNIKFRW